MKNIIFKNKIIILIFLFFILQIQAISLKYFSILIILIFFMTFWRRQGGRKSAPGTRSSLCDLFVTHRSPGTSRCTYGHPSQSTLKFSAWTLSSLLLFLSRGKGTQSRFYLPPPNPVPPLKLLFRRTIWSIWSPTNSMNSRFIARSRGWSKSRIA
jgi:hypothetical protein